MIPIIGVPILNRGDLLTRLVKSIEYPVNKFFIINNGNDEGVAAAIEEIKNGLNPLIQEVEVYKPEKNLGCAGSWNSIIAWHLTAPYWLIVGNDIQFAKPGELEMMAKHVEERLDTHSIIYASEYSCFFLTQLGLEKIGTFDENFYPAYGEEADHFKRVKVSGTMKERFFDLGLIHGEPPFFQASTINSNEAYQKANAITSQMNKDYHIKKWGGPSACDPFQNPFNDPGIPIDHWELDVERRKQLEDIWSAAKQNA